MSATALKYYIPANPYWNSYTDAIGVEEHLDSPWNSLTEASGSSQLITGQVSAESGVNSWLEKILHASEENTCSLTTPEVPNALVEIREAFSINTVQLAQVLRVSRQAIYDWNDGKPVKVENRQRISRIRELARQWHENYSMQMGRISSEEISGQSLIGELSADYIDTVSVSNLFISIASKLVEMRMEKPSAARSLAKKYGMEAIPEDSFKKNISRASFRYGRKEK